MLIFVKSIGQFYLIYITKEKEIYCKR